MARQAPFMAADQQTAFELVARWARTADTSPTAIIRSHSLADLVSAIARALAKQREETDRVRG